jgi:hypothetical protein
MARSGILYSDVAKAASQLTELGHPVTVDNVRKMLGDTGSKSTIAPYLRQWRENHALESESSRLKLPPSCCLPFSLCMRECSGSRNSPFQAEKLHEETVTTLQIELQALKKRLDESAQAHQEALMELRLSQKEHRKTLETLERERLQSLAQQQQITLLDQRLTDKLLTCKCRKSSCSRPISSLSIFRRPACASDKKKRQCMKVVCNWLSSNYAKRRRNW